MFFGEKFLIVCIDFYDENIFWEVDVYVYYVVFLLYEYDRRK